MSTYLQKQKMEKEQELYWKNVKDDGLRIVDKHGRVKFRGQYWTNEKIQGLIKRKVYCQATWRCYYGLEKPYPIKFSKCITIKMFRVSFKNDLQYEIIKEELLVMKKIKW